jgi:hypothetical protein
MTRILFFSWERAVGSSPCSSTLRAGLFVTLLDSSFLFFLYGPEFLFAHGVRMHQVALLYEIIIVTNKGTLGTADIDSFLSALTPRPACRVLFHQKKDVSKYSNGRNDRNHLKGVCHALVTPSTGSYV